jgi:glycosyl transferase family 2
MNVDVTASISTKDRFGTTLALTLQAIALQIVRPKQLVIFDDGDFKDHREESPYNHLFKLLMEKGIVWYHLPGAKKGQVANHQMTLDQADTGFVWRVDDDEVPEPNVLGELLEVMKDPSVGAAAGLVIDPSHPTRRASFVKNRIEDIYSGMNCQWGYWETEKPEEVDHLYSTFLYRTEAARKAGGYCRELSPVGHREETLFSHAVKRAGYKLIVTPKAVTWHLREATGGIRSFKNQSFWEEDEKVFSKKLAEWGVRPRDYKVIVLNNGLGDHILFRSILPFIREKNSGKEILLAASYPEVFEKEKDVTLCSIGDAQAAFGSLDPWHLYKWCDERNWKGPLSEAMKELYS